MYKAFLIKYAEIGIKGKNRHLFEDALVRQICYALRSVDGTFHVHKQQGRVFVETEGDYDYEETIEALSHVFGITGICPAVMVEDEGFDKLAEQVVSYMDQIYPDKHMTFKVKARRARKNYPMDSMELNAALGEKILDAFPDMSVDVHDPNECFMWKSVSRSVFIPRRSRGRRYAGRHRRKGNAPFIRWYRQSGCRLYDLQTWCCH